ncbi:adenylate/guanylate cyclase domain-containing protein [Mucilaginibacter psychrotolerans]|uniref:Adenylate/guanylate cyclase domain-containing protein n=1 Tax=Mucilaginibacter psychrotolerans TaxID=1524096 RepID=A0A4Y8S8Y4_9SPHI|nr:adenylate/guanylate cyclase domain-containing protein [Mucilaginibacter psychrotolerans]TFF34977.1 adenylate/guanylate cyclase domain-containing protein [Mucilaginibacter psychrotolerans]
MPMLSPKAKRNILHILPFGVLWLVFSLVYTLLERGLLGNLTYYPATGNPYFFTRNIVTTPLAALVTGLIMGVLEVFCFNKWFVKKSFSKKILFKSLIYLLIILLFLVITFIGTATDTVAAVSRKAFWNTAWVFFTDYAMLSTTVYIASIILVTQFYAEVSDSIGHAALLNFFLGKYHRPVQEERVFMFLDMRSSTTIAEKLGHVRYFEMLKEYFADLSQPVIDYQGEIYQYAGDEMIISWKLKAGLQNGDCIGCFFAMKRGLAQQASKYEARFGLLPGFKAGLHYGMVTTGEIGVLKKEIIFTGDVLNTAARIQGLCNHFGVDILISGHLAKALGPNLSFETKSLGQHNLKGRDEHMEILTVVFAI